jgi:hypothetical protein
LTGLPPLLIQSGEAEVLRDEITLLAYKASLQGVIVMHEVYDEQVHVFQSLSFLPAYVYPWLSLLFCSGFHLVGRPDLPCAAAARRAKIALASQRDFVLRALPAFRAEAAASAAAAQEDVVTSLPSSASAGPTAANDEPGLPTSVATSTGEQQQQRPLLVGRRSSTAAPAVPPIPLQFRRTRSALGSASEHTPVSPAVDRRPTLKSSRSHPAQIADEHHRPHQHGSRQASSTRLQRSSSGPGTPPPAPVAAVLTSLASSIPSAASLPSPLAVPPTPPKGRNRSLTNPEVWALIREFEADTAASMGVVAGSANGGATGAGNGSYTIRRFAAAPPDTAAATTAAAAAVEAADSNL